MNIAIIGAGFMGKMHANILEGFTHVALKGICGKSSDRAQQIADTKGIRCYESLDDVLADESIGIIDICSPTSTHAKFAIKAMQAGKHTIIEYPVCETEEELKQIDKTQKITNKRCAVAYYSRYQSQLNHLFNALAGNEAGGIMDIRFSRRSQNYFASSDIVNNLMSQDIDFMVRLLGLPEKIVHSNIKQDYGLLVFEYNKARAIIEGATNMHPGFPFSLNVFVSGTKASIELAWRFTDKPEYDFIFRGNDKTERIETEDYDPYVLELKTILEKINDNENDPMYSLGSVMETAKLTFHCRDLIENK